MESKAEVVMKILQSKLAALKYLKKTGRTQSESFSYIKQNESQIREAIQDLQNHINKE